ncbi:hypothetical protein FRB95_003394 [Tulasnella sp. JGI-2019a]|nr:hypothetical protein FRB95_003394 [Tulasnella sp. JGI-2019a]
MNDLRGVAATVALYGDRLGATAQILVDGTSVQSVDTVGNVTEVWTKQCRLIIASTPALSYGIHNMTLEQSGPGYLYFGNFTYATSLPASVSTVVTSSTIAASLTATSASAASSNSTTSAAQAGASHSPTGPIVGGVVGGLVLLVIVAVVAWILLSRRRHSQRNTLRMGGAVDIAAVEEDKYDPATTGGVNGLPSSYTARP